LKVVDSNLKDLKSKKASVADQASEKKFRDGLNKQILNIKKKANILAKKTSKSSFSELIKLNKSQSKFNGVYLTRVNAELKKKGISPKRKASLTKKAA